MESLNQKHHNRSSAWMFAMVAALVISVYSLLSATVSAQEISQQERSELQSIINSQIEAFRMENADRAFSFAAPSIRQMFGSPDRFVSMVEQQYLPVYRPKNYVFGEIDLSTGHPIQEVYLTGPKGRDWVASYHFELQPDGSWKISACYLRELERTEV